MSPDDILVWPDGEWCFAHELAEMAHRGDDYIRIADWEEDYYKYVEI